MRFAVLFLLPAALLAQKKPVTLETLREAARLPQTGPGNPLAWSPEGDRFLYRQERKLVIFDIATQTARDLAETAAMEEAAVRRTPTEPQPFDWENRRVSEQPVQWSPSGEILYAAGGDLFLINSASGRWRQITKTPEAERDPKLSPDGRSVAFRRGWDLYALDLASGRERQLTRGGSEALRNGGLDWVYPEELDLGTAYWWSPDSRSIAYLQFDVSTEPWYPHHDARIRPAIAEPQRYPQAGQDNPHVRLGVVPASGGGTRWLDVGNTRADYLVARVTWTPDSRLLYVIRPNRVQNQVELLAFEAGSGRRWNILEESDPFWVNLPDEPRFIGGGAEFLWTSERTGFRHIYLYSADGKRSRPLTEGDWEVTAVSGVDEAARRVFYVSSEPGPRERHLYSIGLDGRDKRRLSSGAGTHSMTLGPKARYFLHTYSSASSPPRTTLHAGDGREIGVYREADRRVAEEYELLPVEFLTFQGPDHTTLHARLIRPANFDPAKKYPAVVFVYGGPGAQAVRDSWLGADFDQVLAHAGFVVWTVDNRGSSGRGHAFETPVFGRLGQVELRDQVAGVEYLVALGFVDPRRVGIRGWSYGGFMTLNALLNAPKTFAAGVAGAPVTDWHNYDTIYTERYMGLPRDNPDGYRETALPQRARNLEGKLLLVHNLEDDNVLFQNSVQMIAELERAGKLFETVLYTQKSHSVLGPESQHLNAAMLDFFERRLK
jgi:dipeptidyl-peptidase-4